MTLGRLADLHCRVLVIEVAALSLVVEAGHRRVDVRGPIVGPRGVVGVTNGLGELQLWNGLFLVFILDLLFSHAQHVAPLVVTAVKHRWESGRLLHCIEFVSDLRLLVDASVS